MAKRGPKSTITFTVEKEELKVADGKIKQLLRSTVRPFSVSGGYIPIPQEYKGNEVFVIVMEKKDKK